MKQQAGLKNTRYYQIINLNTKYALYISSVAQSFQLEQAYLIEPKERSLGQIWQVIRLPDNPRFSGCYEIVHTRSTLVLTKLQDGEVRLKFGEWSSTQLFRLEMPENQDTYRFVSYENNKHLLHFDKMLKIGPIDRNDKKCKWIIQPCVDNLIINRSCYLQNTFSNMVIDVPKASLQSGCALIQYPCNNRFNQRFNLFYEKNHYKIANLNSKMFITAHKRCGDGDKITQEGQCKNIKQQQWIFEYQGANLYLIRSVLNPQMMLGIKGNSPREAANLVTTMDEESCLWKVVGHMPYPDKI